MRRLLPVLGLLLAAPVLLLPAAPAAADPGADIAVTGLTYGDGTVSFLASARGVPAGTSLKDAQVRVAADGVALETALGESTPATAPTRAVAVVVDISGSMKGAKLEAARSAAAEYATLLPDDVRLGLVTVSTKAAVVLAPTTDRARYAAALKGLKAAGSTALYDGLVAAATSLRTGLPKDTQRRIVVLSDGEDSSHTTTLPDVVAALGTDQTAADIVGFQLSAKGTANATGLADGTGGRMISASDGQAVADAFRFIASAFSAPVRVTAQVPPSLDGRRLTLTVSANLAGREVTASTAPGTLHAHQIKVGELPRAMVPQPPNSLGYIVAGTVFAALFVLLSVVLRPAIARASHRRRINQVTKFSGLAIGPESERQGGRQNPIVQAALALAERTISSEERRHRIVAELERAGINLRPHEWTLLRIGVAAGAGLVLSLFVPFGMVIGGVLGWLATKFYRTRRTGRRASKFSAQLPDALQLIVGSLQSGFSLAQAVSAVVKDSADPIGPELNRALSATRLGTSLEDGLEGVAQRVGSQDLEWAVMTIRIQREVGGNLAEVLQTAVETMRERDGLRRHVRALSAEGRMSAWVLTGMPIAVATWMFLLRREYLRPLYTEALGIAMLVAAVSMVCFGAFWMSRLIKVDV